MKGEPGDVLILIFLLCQHFKKVMSPTVLCVEESLQWNLSDIFFTIWLMLWILGAGGTTGVKGLSHYIILKEYAIRVTLTFIYGWNWCLLCFCTVRPFSTHSLSVLDSVNILRNSPHVRSGELAPHPWGQICYVNYLELCMGDLSIFSQYFN